MGIKDILVYINPSIVDAVCNKNMSKGEFLCALLSGNFYFSIDATFALYKFVKENDPIKSKAEFDVYSVPIELLGEKND